MAPSKKKSKPVRIPGVPRAIASELILGGKRKRGRGRVRVGSQRQLLAGFIQQHCHRFPSEPRLMAAAAGNPMPAEPCTCWGCRGMKQGWPVGYQRQGTGKSFECWLHEQSEWFLESLPHSSSIVRFK